MTRLATSPRRLLAALLLASAAVPAAAETFQVNVSDVGTEATPLWTPTGITLAPGQTVRITTDPAALWSFGTPWTMHTAAGATPWEYPNIVDRFLCVANHGELIGTVGTDPYLGNWRNPYYDYTYTWTGPQDCTGQIPGYLHVGECAVTQAGFQFTATQAGPLWLGINDDADTGAIGDNGQASLPVTVEVDPAGAPVAAVVDLQPGALQLGAGGAWVTAYVEIPGADVASVVRDSIVLSDGLGHAVAADPLAPSVVGDHDGDGVPDLAVKFSRAVVAGFYAGITSRTTAAITVSGNLADCSRFEGADALRVIP